MIIFVNYDSLDNEVIEYESFEELMRETNYNNIVYLNCFDNKLTSLPELPKSLKVLYCFSNKLTNLPELPKGLEVLKCFNNKLTKLPELPKSLETLSCHHNKLTNLPELPKSLKELDCSNNKLKVLPELPNTLKELICYSNKITSLPKSLIDCRNIIHITYSDNEIELTIQQMNYLNRGNNYSRKIIYDDRQNVHNSGIQKCIYNNIQILMEDE